MKFSVLIPVYNGEKYLQNSVDSVFAQTNDNFEIVLIDDGSTDGSGKLCDALQNEYPDKVKVIHQQNEGQLASRCKAAKAASGDYCIFLDADDAIEQNTFEKLDGIIKKYHHPDMVIYSFLYDRGENHLKKAARLFEDETVFEADSKQRLYEVFFKDSLLNNVWTKAIKTEKLLKCSHGFEQYYDLRCSEDRLHSMAMVDACDRIVYIYAPLYRYKIVEGSVTRQFSYSAIEQFRTVKLYNEELKYIDLWKLPLPEWRQRLNAGYAYQTWDLFYRFYTQVKNGRERNLVLKYDWTSFLDKTALNGISDNPYVNATYKMCWNWIINKNYCAIKNYLFKKKIKKILRSGKRNDG